jgi:hypothetical protein
VKILEVYIGIQMTPETGASNRDCLPLVQLFRTGVACQYYVKSKLFRVHPLQLAKFC